MTGLRLCVQVVGSSSSSPTTTTTPSAEEDGMTVSPQSQASSLTTRTLMTVELRSRIAVMLLTAIVVMGTRKAHYGAIAGWLSD